MSSFVNFNLFEGCKKKPTSPKAVEVEEIRAQQTSPQSLKDRSSPNLWKGRSSPLLRKSDSATCRFIPILSDTDKAVLKRKTRNLMEPGKGIFLFDESTETLGERFEAKGIENDCKNKITYLCAVLDQCKKFRHFLSGIVINECSFNTLNVKECRPFLKAVTDIDIALGVRVDKKQIELLGTDGEVTTDGAERSINDYIRFKEVGVSFVVAKYVFYIDTYTPSYLAIIENARIMSRFASTSLSAGLVPVLALTIKQNADEEVPADVNASLQQSVLQKLLSFVVKSLADHHVYLEGVILSITPVYLPCGTRTEGIPSLAKTTWLAIKERVPPAIGGVCISDSISLKESTNLLNAINYSTCIKPCPLSFALGKHLKEGLIDIWAGQEKNVKRMGKELAKRLKICSLASMGQLPRDQYTFFVTNVTAEK